MGYIQQLLMPNYVWISDYVDDDPKIVGAIADGEYWSSSTTFNMPSVNFPCQPLVSLNRYGENNCTTTTLHHQSQIQEQMKTTKQGSFKSCTKTRNI
jgi:hypothetical protein